MGIVSLEYLLLRGPLSQVKLMVNLNSYLILLQLLRPRVVVPHENLAKSAEIKLHNTQQI